MLAVIVREGISRTTGVIASCLHANFNITTTAGFYSALVGVLAGFAFTALITILTVHQDGARFADATKALVVAFVGLVITSVSYAVLAGEHADQGRVVMEEVLVGIAFATCAVQLIYAVALTFKGAGTAQNASPDVYSDVARRLMAIAAIILCPLVVEYITVAMQDYKAVHPDRAGYVLSVGHTLVGVTFIASCIIWAIRGKLRKFGHSRWRDLSYAVTLVMVIAPLFASALIVDKLGSCTVPPPIVMEASLVFTFLAMLMATANFAVTSPP